MRAIVFEGFAERTKEITSGQGVAAVYDGVGRTFDFKCRAPFAALFLSLSRSFATDRPAQLLLPHWAEKA